MANVCDFKMRVVGKKVDCEEWLHRMEDENAKHHFYFDCVFNHKDNGNDNKYMMDIEACCRYSLEHCKSSENDGIEDIYALNTMELHLEMEAWSNVEGDDFQEHIRYEFGECMEKQEVFFDERIEDWKFESFEELAQYVEDEYGESIEEDDLDTYGNYYVGGFDDYMYFSISI